jgi:hypothetical protein
MMVSLAVGPDRASPHHLGALGKNLSSLHMVLAVRIAHTLDVSVGNPLALRGLLTLLLDHLGIANGISLVL